MHSQRVKLAALDTGIRPARPDRFTPLLTVIRVGLGDQWAFYEECIRGVLDAARTQQDTTAWNEQMQQLVEGIEKVQISHEGIMFLLQDMGIHTPKQQYNNAGKSLSLTLSPHEHRLEAPSSSKPDTGPSSLPSSPTMTSLLALQPQRPPTPAIAEWPVARIPTPRPQQPHSQPQTETQKSLQKPQQPQQDPKQQMPQPRRPRVLCDGVLPFDFSEPVLPGLTFPKNLRAYHYPPETITMTSGYESPPPTPLRQFSRDPVFYGDEVLRREVAEVFGVAGRLEGGRRHRCANVRHKGQRLQYVAEDDDLLAWKMRGEASSGGESGEVKASAASTWPPWNFRFDLEL